MAANTSRWSTRSCRYVWRRMLHCLSLLLTVSCLILTIYIIFFLSMGQVIHLGQMTLAGDSPMYPSSASTRSNGSSQDLRDLRKILRSFNFPGWWGPLIQQMSPVFIPKATSYRRPDPLNLYEYQSGPLSGIGTSVPSTDIKQSLPVSPLYLLSSLIWKAVRITNNN